VTSSNVTAGESCWQLRCNKEAWFDQFGFVASTWTPLAGLNADIDALRAALIAAAQRREPWLLHPCATAITDRVVQSIAADARLAVWAALNADDSENTDLGSIRLNAETWVWGHEGAFALDPGAYRLQDLAKNAHSAARLPVPDPWGDSFSYREDFGDLIDHAWWSRTPLTEEDQAQLADDIRALLRAEQALSVVLPDTISWVADVTRVIVPLANSPSNSFRSGTLAQLPGVVLIEVTSQPLLTMEALVHESAHLHFHMEEVNAPFFVEGHAQLYDSPLRPDPRPLRGIFLAYHALGYMCAMYNDWWRATGDKRCVEALGDLVKSRDDACATLRNATNALTDAGQSFLEMCQMRLSESAST
jgi:hypothetical protein